MSKNLIEWLDYLESIHPTTIDMGLDRVTEVAGRLNINFSSTVITVGGTNGKGTTSALIENALLLDGKTVGVYSSPHLIDYRERVRINNQLPEETEFCAAFERVEAARGTTSLTYFEFGTLAALLMLMDARLDVVVLEVGLGGRLDATNIVEPDCAVITSIGLDHQDWLGDTRELIAVEKAGIIRRQGKVVIGEPDPPETLIDEVKRLEADAWWQDKQFSIQTKTDKLIWQGNEQVVELSPTDIPLTNVATALAVLQHTGFVLAPEILNQAVKQTKLPGRRQLIDDFPPTYLDVGHNPQATASLAEWLQTNTFKQLHIVVAMLNDKDPQASLANFAAFEPSFYVGSTHGPRGLDGQALAHAAPAGLKVDIFASVNDAYEAAREQAGKDDLILVVGSFHTVADILVLPHNTQNI